MRFVCSWSEAEQRTRLGCFFHFCVFSKWQEFFLLSPSVEPEECSVGSPGACHLHRQWANIPIGKPYFPGQLVCVSLGNYGRRNKGCTQSSWWRAEVWGHLWSLLGCAACEAEARKQPKFSLLCQLKLLRRFSTTVIIYCVCLAGMSWQGADARKSDFFSCT